MIDTKRDNNYIHEIEWLSELEKLVQSVYEDKVRGERPEAFCIQLMHKYEDERKEKAGTES